METGFLTQEEYEAIRAQGEQIVEKAVEFATNSPEPNVATLMEGIYAD
jgi:TPP-dependent pyruvate/acetoin dehydrogenase alpha subunit